MKSKNRTLLMSLIFMFLFSMLLTESIAQETNKKISGTILSATTGDPVPGATVVVKKTKISTVTGLKGEFTIEAEKGDVLIITSSEYEAKEVKSASSTLDIRIEEKYRKLEDVVVIGYGKMKKTDMSR